MIDSHAHLNTEFFDESSIPEIIEHCKLKGIKKIINIGTNFASIKLNQDIALRYPDFVLYTIGLHPHETSEIDLVLKLEENLKDAIGIGECGLDYYWTEYNKPETEELQKSMFIQQINISNVKNLPLIIHCRGERAPEDMINILKNTRHTTGGIWHSVAGSKEEVKIMLDLGFYMSFNGILTFKNSDATRDLLSYIPLDRIVIETDCPFLAPAPFRGQKSDPSYLPLIAETVAVIKKVSLKGVENITTKNLEEVFSSKLTD